MGQFQSELYDPFPSQTSTHGEHIYIYTHAQMPRNTQFKLLFPQMFIYLYVYMYLKVCVYKRV